MVGSQSMLQTELASTGKLTEFLNETGIPTFLTGMARGLLGRYFYSLLDILME